MEYSEIVCRWIDKQDLWKVADGVRDQYWSEGSLPVDTENIVEFQIQLGIEPIHSLFHTIGMDAYLKGDLTAIVVDYDFYMNDKYSNRMRFSFAHELGHLFLHQYAYSQFDFASPSEWQDFIFNIPEKEYGNFEWQANEFAGRLLVPYLELNKELVGALPLGTSLMTMRISPSEAGEKRSSEYFLTSPLVEMNLEFTTMYLPKSLILPS